jgi:hypothetical protein
LIADDAASAQGLVSAPRLTVCEVLPPSHKTACARSQKPLPQSTVQSAARQTDAPATRTSKSRAPRFTRVRNLVVLPGLWFVRP